MLTFGNAKMQTRTAQRTGSRSRRACNQRRRSQHGRRRCPRSLQDAIRHLHGLEATWLESVPVHEKHEGATGWEGEVQVFAVEHPKANRLYAWSHESEGGKRRFHVVLGAKPVDGAVMAVRTAVLGQSTTSGTA